MTNALCVERQSAKEIIEKIEMIWEEYDYSRNEDYNWCPVCYGTYLTAWDDEESCSMDYGRCDCGTEEVNTPWQFIRMIIPDLPEVPAENIKYQFVMMEKK